MRKLAYLGALALVLVMLIAPSAAATGQQTTANIVYIRDFYFSPASISVQPGTTVTWVNAGRAPHTVTSDDGQFDSGVLMPGDSYKVKFVGQGTLTYYCAIHPFMRGSVGVGTTPTVTAGTPAMGAGGRPMGGQPMSMPSGY
jgi:plastocyanin